MFSIGITYASGVFGGSGGLQASSLKKGLVGHWTMSEGYYNSATNQLKDRTPNGNHASINSAQGQFSENGWEKTSFTTNPAVIIPHNDLINFNNLDSFSVAVWVRIDETEDTNVNWSANRNSGLYKGSNNNSYGVAITGGDSSKPSIRGCMRHSGGTRCVSFAAEWGQLYHAVMTMNQSSQMISLYIDGELHGTTSYDSSINFANTNNWHMLNDWGVGGNGGSVIRGLINDARIYNRAISPEEVDLLYNSFSPESYSFSKIGSGLVGYWKIEKGNDQEYTENIFPRSSSSLAFTSAYNGSSYGFGSNTNIQQEIDNSLKSDSKSAVTKVSRINSGVSQRDYVHLGMHSPLNSTRVISFWYYGTYGTQIRPYNNDGSASLYYLDDNNDWIGGGTGVNIPVPTNQWKKITVKMVNRGSSSGTGWSWFVMHYNTLTATLSNQEYWAFTEFQLEEKPYATPYVDGIRESRLTDYSPYSNHGTIYGASFVEDRFGKANSALSFNGSSDYIISENLDFNINGGDWTASVWFYVDSENVDGNWNTVLGIGQQYLNGFHIFENRICTYTSSAFCIGFGDVLSSQEWHFVSVVHELDSKRITVYVDGTEHNSGMYSETLVDALNRPMTSGWRGTSSQYFKGFIDNMRIHNRALSEDEIKSLHGSYKPQLKIDSLSRGLVGHWPLTDTWSKNNNGILIDRTPYSNHGTNNGAIITNEGAEFNENTISFSSIKKHKLYNSYGVGFWISYETSLRNGSPTSMGGRYRRHYGHRGPYIL